MKEGVKEGLTDGVLVAEEPCDAVPVLEAVFVAVRVIVTEGVTDGVPDVLAVLEAVTEAVLDFEGDTLGVGDVEVVCVCETV